MQPLTHTQIAIWVLSPLLLTAVAVGMIRKSLLREMPLFFCYTVFHILAVVAFTIAYRNSYAAYFYVYWGSEAIDALLTLLVLQEIFGIVFRPYDSLRSLGGTVFRVGLIVLVAVAVVSTKGLGDYGTTKRVAALIAVQRSTQFVEIGMIIILFMFSRLFGLTWRNYVFGVTLGFGLIASICGPGLALRALTPPPFDRWAEAVLPFGFMMGALVWGYYLLMPSSSFEIDRAQVDASRLKGWNRALEGMLNR
jgi:hypothetical protein